MGSPFLTMLIQVDKRKLKEAYEDDLWKHKLAEMATSRMAEQDVKYMAWRRKQIGLQNMRQAGWIEGLGQEVAQYDAEMWFRAIHHGDRYFWADNANVKKYKEDNPEVIIRP